MAGRKPFPLEEADAGNTGRACFQDGLDQPRLYPSESENGRGSSTAGIL